MAGDQNKFKLAMTHAERFSQQENWADAIKAYRFALAEFPNNEAAIIGFGQANLAVEQTEIAWKAFQQALKVNPSSYQALLHTADIQERMRQYEAAAETYLRMGNIFASQNNLEAAVESWQRAVELVPDKIDAHQKLAQGLAQQGQTRPAARAFLRLAAIYQNRDDQENVISYIERAEDLIPNDPGVAAAREALGRGTLIQPDQISDTPPPEVTDSLEFTEDFGEDPFGDVDIFATDNFEAAGVPTKGLVEATQQKALEELANVIFEDESDFNAPQATISQDQINMLIIQAIDLQSRENIAEAAHNYRQVIQAGAGRVALYFNLGLLYKTQRHFDEAAKMLKMSAQDKQYSASSQFALGETYYAAGKLELAARHFIEALRIIDFQTVSGQKAYDLAQVYESLADDFIRPDEPQKMKGFISAAQTFFANPMWEKRVFEARQRMNSIADDRKIMSLVEFLETPETEIIVTTMAMTSEYIKRNLLMTASEECLRAIQKAPSYLMLHVRLADILLKQEHTDEAITKYLYIARVYQMRKQPDQAVNIYQKILRLAPMDVTVRSKLIDLYISENNVEQALEQYLTLADSYYQLAQVDRSLEKYQEALRLAANTPNASINWRANILNRMGDIYGQRFDWVRATTSFEELLTINNEDERTQRQLIDLYYKQNKTSKAVSMLNNLLARYQKQDPLEALNLLRDLASIYSEDMYLRQQLAAAYAQNGMNREAIIEYDALGEMQLENGLRDQARQTVQAIINLGPDDVEGYRRLLAQISG